MISCQLRDIQIGDYFLAESYPKRVQALIKVAASDIRFVINRASPPTTLQPEEKAGKFTFPHYSTSVHEAGHFVYSLLYLDGTHRGDGIEFFPHAPGNGGHPGSWLNTPSPSQTAQLSFAGIISRLHYAPKTFEEVFREAISYSTIFADDHPFNAKISEADKKYMAGAEEDFRQIWDAGRAYGSNAVRFLRGEELIVRRRTGTAEFQNKVEKISTAVPKWFLAEGRTSWENAILYGQPAFIPRAEILQII